MTGETFEAIQSLFNAAVEDQQVYQQDGNPEVDYGDDWPEVARTKAQEYRLVADWLQEQGGWGGLIDEMRRLAESCEASAREYRNPEVGN